MATEEERKKKAAERRLAAKRAWPALLQLARPYRRLLAMAFGLIVINRTASMVLPAAPKYILDEALAKGNLPLLYQIAGAIAAASVVQALTSFAMIKTVSKAGQRLIRDLRLKMQDHVSRLPLRYFDTHRTGEVTTRVMNDVEGVRDLLGTGILELVSGALTAIIAMVWLLYFNWQLTVAAVCFIALFALVIVKAFKRLRPIIEERQESTAQLNARLQESIGGIRVVKAYTAEEEERRAFRGGVDTLYGAIVKTIDLVATVGVASSTMMGATGCIVLVLAGHQIYIGEMTAGELISYILFLGFMIAPVGQAISIGNSLTEALAGLDRMNQVLSQPAEDAEEARRAPVPSVQGRVAFDGVEFHYEEGKEVLRGVSFEAEPGSITALVGPSGSGKSTIVNLIAGFYRPVRGRVLVDGRDLAELKLLEYRRHLGVVLQDSFLFAGTVRDNIEYARLGATFEEVEAAARAANALEFIEKLPQRWETVIGERGVKLSGGQRQRVSIARALLANPRILILDEATSALDSESEALIQEALRGLMRGRTSFVIAHRLSTIRGATQILFIEEGRIVERGRHEELLKAGGRYAEMYAMQHGLDDSFVCPGEEPVGAEDPLQGDDESGSPKRTPGLLPKS